MSDISLRNYQQEYKKQIYEAWLTNNSVMLQMPTGTGKTRLFASIVRDLHDHGSKIKKAIKVLLLVHRQELINQISETLGMTYNIRHGIILSKALEQTFYPTQVASVQTLKRRLKSWESKSLIIS